VPLQKEMSQFVRVAARDGIAEKQLEDLMILEAIEAFRLEPAAQARTVPFVEVLLGRVSSHRAPFGVNY
jgi:hypothetical protein